MKNMVLNVRPKDCLKIFHGRKNVIVMGMPLKADELPVRAFIYCKKGRDTLISVDWEDWDGNALEKPLFVKAPEDGSYQFDTGKVVGEVVIDRIAKLDRDSVGWLLFENGKERYLEEINENPGSYTGWVTDVTLDEIKKKYGIFCCFLWHAAENITLYRRAKPIEEFELKRAPKGWQFIKGALKNG